MIRRIEKCLIGVDDHAITQPRQHDRIGAGEEDGVVAFLAGSEGFSRFGQPLLGSLGGGDIAVDDEDAGDTVEIDS